MAKIEILCAYLKHINRWLYGRNTTRHSTPKLSPWIKFQEFVYFSSLIQDSFVSSFSYQILGKGRLHILYYAILFTKKILLHFCQVIARPNYRVRDTYTHLAIWTNAPRKSDRFCNTTFWMYVTHLEGKQEWS